MGNLPHFILNKPEPKSALRLYNGRKLMIFEGKIKISSIEGWIDNPRIALAKKNLQSEIGNRTLTQEEIFELMKEDGDIRLKELRDDIIKNGLREPLTLSHSGRLLDGNRRFFAIKYALEKMPTSDPNRQDLEIIDVHVLTEDASEEDEQNVLVEENFSPSLKIEWPEYVKAMKIIHAQSAGLSIDDLAEKFGWPKSKIRETLKINELIQDFIAFATADRNLDDEFEGGLGLVEQEAECIAAKNYQFFNEAQKSFFDPLRTDIHFKIQFFRWIYEGKFSSFQEVRIAYNAWKTPDAKAVLMQPNPAAAKSAKAILDYNARIVRNVDDSANKIECFLKFLNELTAQEISSIPETCRAKLKEALELVIKMNEAVLI